MSSSVAHYDFISCYNSQIAEATKAVSAEHSAVTSSAHLPVVLASDDRNNVLQNRETPAFSNEASTPLAAPLVTVQKEQSASFDLKPTTKAHKKEESPDVIEVGNSKELSASVVPSSNYNELPAAAVYYFKTSPQAIYLTKAPIPITIQKEPTGYKETLFSNTQLALKDEIPVTSVHSEEKKEDSALFERMPLDEYYVSTCIHIYLQYYFKRYLTN